MAASLALPLHLDAGLPCLRAVSSLAQTSQGNATGETYSLSGTVINSLTGEPIRGALVQISVETAASVFTGSDGSFRFVGLPPSEVQVTARKPGFFDEREHSQRPVTEKSIRVGPDSPPIVVKLSPEGVVFGVVQGADGEPVEDLPVRLTSAHVINGRKEWQRGASVTTNEDGEFRFADLLPGVYYVSAGPSRSASLKGGVSQRTEEGYPNLYYPGVSGIESAEPIKIVAGSRARLEFALKRESFFRVSGIVSGYDLGASVRISVAGKSGEPYYSIQSFDPRTGIFILKAIPAGFYVASASARNASGQVFAANTPLTVNSDISGVRLVLEPTLTVPVTVRLESGQASDPENRPGVQIRLTSDEATFLHSGGWAAGVIRQDTGLQFVHNVLPGTYSVEIAPNGPWYVQSATCGGKDLLRANLTLAPGALPSPIEIVLGADLATLSGDVWLDGKRAQGTVLLIPDFAAKESKIVFTDPEGSFHFGGLAPGAYRVLALNRGDDFEYQNPELLSRYLFAAREVKLLANAKATMRLELVRRGD